MLPAPSLECRRAGMKLHSRSISSYKAPLMSRDSCFLASIKSRRFQNDVLGRLFRRSRQVRATAAGDQRSFLIVEVGFSGRKLTAHAHDACLRRDVTGHGGFVIIHAQVDRRYRTAKSCCNGVICSHVDDGGKDAAMRETAFGMDDPFLAPGGLDLDAVFPCADCRKVEPLIEGSPHDQFLKFFDSYRFIAHRMSPGKSLSPPTRVGVPYRFCWCRRAATVGGKRRGADVGRPDRWPERIAGDLLPSPGHLGAARQRRTAPALSFHDRTA